MANIFRKIGNFYDGAMGLPLPPLVALLLVAWLLWPLTPTVDNHFSEAALAIMILINFAILGIIQTVSLLFHLLGFRTFYVTTLTKARNVSDTKIFNRFLAVLSYPFDMMRILGFSLIPIIGWAYVGYILRGNFADKPWNNRIFRNFVFSTLIVIILGGGYFFSVIGQQIRPAEQIIAGKPVFGLVNVHGDWVKSPEFDDIRPFARGALLTPFRKGDKWGYLGKNGSVILEPVFDHIGWWDTDRWDEYPMNVFDNLFPRVEKLLPCRKHNLWGFIGTNGLWSISPQFEEVRPFSGKCWFASDGLAPVKIGNLWGFIDLSGQIAVTPRFEQAFSLENHGKMGDRYEATALVKFNGTWGLFQPPNAFDPLPENEGDRLMPAAHGMAKGYVDNTGSFVLQPHYSRAEDFRHGFAVVENSRMLAADSSGFSRKTSVNELINTRGEVLAWKKTHGGRWIYQEPIQNAEKIDRYLEEVHSKRGRRVFLFVHQGLVGVLDPVNGMLLPPRYVRSEIEDVIKAQDF